MPPGDYRISISIYDPDSDTTLAAHDMAGGQIGNDRTVTSVRIEKDKSSITASDLQRQYQLEQPYFVDMGEIRLIGFKPIPKAVVAGQVLPVGLYWRARDKPRGNYLVAVQLRDASGRVAFEQKSRPADGTYPTTEWDAGEVLLDWHDLIVPPSLMPGVYTIQVVLSDSKDGGLLGETALTPVSVVK
jgi:hypothetical protein